MSVSRRTRWGIAGGGVAGVTAAVVASFFATAIPTATTAELRLATADERSPAPTSAARDQLVRARNVIFIQGDGMGIAHRELIRLATKGRNGELAMNQMDYTGFVHTDPADPDEAVTDSAAAATAYASGVRTYNGAVGVDLNGRSVPTLMERAKRAGKATGLVTTSQVTDATPAAFASHVANRSNQSEIARQIIEKTKVDVVLGGGEDFWYPKGNPGAWPDHPATDPSEQSRGTAGNLVRRARDLGYRYVRNRAELADVRRGKVLGLFANEEMFEHHNEGQGDLYNPSVPLRTMSTKALELLSADRDGFFLLIEEEAIDEMAHHGNAHLTVKSGAALDQTVATALQFAARTPGTLVVVVGDHETGGLAIESVSSSDENPPGEQSEDRIKIAHSDLSMDIDWTTNGHTGAATPITAQGPGAERLGKVLKNTDVHDAILRAMTSGG